MKNLLKLIASFAMSCLAFQAPAAGLPKEGIYDFVSCYSGTVNSLTFSKTHSANTTEFTGTIQSNPPGGLFDKVAFRCISFNYSAEGKNTGTTVCEGVDKDGDKYLNHIVNDGTTSTRKVVAGTGKYDGIVASGTVEGMGPFGVLKPETIQNCSHQKGTYKMK
jgi:hypothetical protein